MKFKNIIETGYPAQIIRIKTESWVDCVYQLIFKKTIRQMRSLTNGDYYLFEDEVNEDFFEELDLGSCNDGFYQIIGNYETDENGNIDGCTYELTRLIES